MRFFSTLSREASRIQRLLQPKRITENFLPVDLGNSIAFSLRNGTDHFTLPLQRIIFTYCPHNGDSRPLMEYLKENIISFAENNPSVEVIVSCKFSSRPKIEAFYNGDFEHRRMVQVGGGAEMSGKDVKVQVDRLRDFSGFKAKKFKLQVISDAQAVRPIYSQFLHPNPRINFNFEKHQKKL